MDFTNLTWQQFALVAVVVAGTDLSLSVQVPAKPTKSTAPVTVLGPDFLLEYWSDYERRSPGWIEKDLACDFIAYAFVPSRRKRIAVVPNRSV
jgi:hypothetical protein